MCTSASFPQNNQIIKANIHKVNPGKQVVHFKTYVKWVFPFNVNMIGFSP